MLAVMNVAVIMVVLLVVVASGQLYELQVVMIDAPQFCDLDGDCEGYLYGKANYGDGSSDTIWTSTFMTGERSWTCLPSSFPYKDRTTVECPNILPSGAVPFGELPHSVQLDFWDADDDSDDDKVFHLDKFTVKGMAVGQIYKMHSFMDLGGDHEAAFRLIQV